MSNPLIIDYYTDLLCVWAWIAQRRIDELEERWGDEIQLRHQCINVFGNTADKIGSGWRDRGGYEGFADHVGKAASNYDDAPVHPHVWKTVRPATSATAHLVLKAVGLAESAQAMVEFAGHVRRAFFTEAVDIGKRENLLELTAVMDLPRDAITDVLASGAAMAALMSDYSRAEEQGIKGSPSWVMNEGRQILYGNVGYRILNANIEELLKHPEDEASWCS